MIRTYGGPFGQWINNPPPATTRVFSNEFLQSYYSKFNLKCQAKSWVRFELTCSFRWESRNLLPSSPLGDHDILKKISTISIAKTVIKGSPKDYQGFRQLFQKIVSKDFVYMFPTLSLIDFPDSK